MQWGNLCHKKVLQHWTLMQYEEEVVLWVIVTFVQTALLGSYGGSDMQAGFAAVATTANTVCFLFNFLTDGVSAKLGKNAGAADWVSLRKHVKLALIWYNLFRAYAGIRKPKYRPYLAMELF